MNGVIQSGVTEPRFRSRSDFPSSHLSLKNTLTSGASFLSFPSSETEVFSLLADFCEVSCYLDVAASECLSLPL